MEAGGGRGEGRTSMSRDSTREGWQLSSSFLSLCRLSASILFHTDNAGTSSRTRESVNVDVMTRDDGNGAIF